MTRQSVDVVISGVLGNMLTGESPLLQSLKAALMGSRRRGVDAFRPVKADLDCRRAVSHWLSIGNAVADSRTGQRTPMCSSPATLLKGRVLPGLSYSLKCVIAARQEYRTDVG
jgi:hypothetical protein